MVPTDEELLDTLRSGGAEESLRSLLRAYGGGLYGYAYKRLGDAGLAEEIVQETMLRVWQNADRFDGSVGSLRGWLYQIARNLIVDAHRRRAARPPLAAHITSEVEDGGPTLEQEMLRWQVGAVMGQLRPEHREVIVLVHFDGLKLREVADQLRIPLGTVKSRCFYGLESLRIALEEQGFSQ